MLSLAIFPQAYKQQMFGNNYAWLLTGYHDDNWWKLNINSSCTRNELITALEGHFMFEYMEIRRDSKVTHGLSVTSSTIFVLIYSTILSSL